MTEDTCLEQNSRIPQPTRRKTKHHAGQSFDTTPKQSTQLSTFEIVLDEIHTIDNAIELQQP
jgi:hypothetical protein